MNTTNTLLLYFLIIASTFFFGSATQKRNIFVIGGNLEIFRKIPFFFAFIIPWFFFAFAGMSNDIEEYRYIFEVSTFNNFTSLWIEPGFAALNALIKVFIKDSTVAVVIIKSIIMVLVYKTIYDYRKKVPVGLALLGYMCVAYLDAFCLIRIHLAAALVLFAIDLYDNWNKKILSVLFILLALSIHYSTFIFILALFAYIACVRRDEVSILFLLVMVITLFAASLISVNLIQYLTSSISFLSKYGSKYSNISSSGTGLGQMVLHAPFIMVFYECRNRLNNKDYKDNRLLTIGLILALCSLFFCSMGYSFQVIGRSFVFFIYIWIIVLPRYYQLKREARGNDWVLVGALVVFWFVFKLGIYLQAGSLYSSGIECYSFIWR
jgi:hypothetical protein